MPSWKPRNVKEVAMDPSPKRVLWWGIGCLIIAALVYLLYTTIGIREAMFAHQQSSSMFSWALSAVFMILQNAAFPVGAALIGASVVMRYITPSPPKENS